MVRDLVSSAVDRVLKPSRAKPNTVTFVFAVICD